MATDGQLKAAAAKSVAVRKELAKRPQRIWTQDETNQQLDAIEQLMMVCTTYSKIERAMKRQFAVGAKRTENLHARVQERWAREEKAPANELRQAQIKRILSYVQNARGRRDPTTGAWIEKPNHQALARYERELAMLQGTYRPIKVDVEVVASQAVLHVISNMDADRVAEYLASARRIAGLPEVIDAPAEDAAE